MEQTRLFNFIYRLLYSLSSAPKLTLKTDVASIHLTDVLACDLSCPRQSYSHVSWIFVLLIPHFISALSL